jgi:hypothetical protein
MARLIIYRLFASIIAAMALIGPAPAAEKITKARLVGSWSLISTENTLPNGTRFSPFEKGRGMLVFDQAGRFPGSFCAATFRNSHPAIARKGHPKR